MQTPSEAIRAVIFDMDGLMFDTETLSWNCFRQAVQDCGKSLTEAFFNRTVGLGLPRVRQMYLDHFGADFPFDAALAKKQALAAAFIEQRGVPVKPGLYALLYFLARRGILRAVATSSGRDAATRLLTRSKTADKFTAVVCGDEIAAGKPDPEIFLTAAAKLQRPPQECLVLEDSAAGLLAARRAGMPAIWVPDRIRPEETARRSALAELPDLAAVAAYLRRGGARAAR